MPVFPPATCFIYCFSEGWTIYKVSFRSCKHWVFRDSLFFYISNNFIDRKERDNQSNAPCTKDLQRNWINKIKETRQCQLSYKALGVLKICSLMTYTGRLTPSKIRLFLSYHKFLMTHKGKARRPGLLCDVEIDPAKTSVAQPKTWA